MGLSVAIIAGGRSSRMGTDKGLVMLAGKPMIQRVIDASAELGQDETLLVTNQPDAYARFGLPMFSDILPDKGSLGGIYTALKVARNPAVLVLACDMPFLNTGLLHLMIARWSDSVDIVVPRVEGYPQALHAIYRTSCIPPIEAQLEADQLKIIRFYGKMRVHYLDEPDYTALDPEGLAFSNLNTPEELEQARRRLQ